MTRGQIRGESVGTLGELLAELAEWITKALAELGENEASAHAKQMEIRACWRGSLDNYNLSPLLRADRPLIYADRDSKSAHLPKPRGIRRRGWQIGVQIIRGQVMEVGVVKPTILRPTLDRIERAVNALEQRAENVRRL